MRSNDFKKQFILYYKNTSKKYPKYYFNETIFPLNMKNNNFQLLKNYQFAMTNPVFGSQHLQTD